MTRKSCVILFLAVLASGISCQKKKAIEEVIFKSETFTPEGSFSKGVEGPAVDYLGNLYAVNYGQEGTIGKTNSAGTTELYLTLPTGSVGNGIRFDGKDNMYIADYKAHNVLRINLNTKQLDTFVHINQMKQPNDLAISPNKYLYASDPDWKNSRGAIWRITPDKKTTLLEGDMGTTNGIEVSPDGKRLYVNESIQRNVWAYDLSLSGDISHKALLIKFPNFGMDGMRCDTEGNIYITRHGKGTVVKISPAGKILKEIPTIGKMPSNIAFGGPDGRTAYVTMQDRGCIETFRVDLPGNEWKAMQGK